MAAPTLHLNPRDVRTGVAVLAGSAGHVGILAAGFGWYAWEISRVTSSCEVGGCDPQNYLFSTSLYGLIVLPVTFVAGSAMVLTAWRVAFRPWPWSVQRPLRRMVLVSLVLSPVMILAVAVAVRRLPVAMGATVVVPVVSAVIAGVGSVRRATPEPALP